MIVRPQDYLVRLRPRGDTLYASQSRTVLATDRDGFISGGADDGLLVASVCRGVLCPQLASMRDYTNWMRAGGFTGIEAEDITRRVEGTWARLSAPVSRPEIRIPLQVADERTRRFVETFPVIRRAYAEGAMAYGMFATRKA